LSILSLTVSRLDEDLSKGLLLVAALFLTNILSTMFFLGSNTLGHIAGETRTSKTRDAHAEKLATAAMSLD